MALNFKEGAERDLEGMETRSKPITRHTLPPFMESVMRDGKS